MARARLSPRAAEAARPLASLPTTVVADLAKRIAAEVAVGLAADDAVSQVVDSHEECKHLSSEDLGALAESITGLHFIWQSSGRNVNEFLDDLIAAYLHIGGEHEEQLRQNAALILGVRALSASAKAISLYSDYERLFISGRILTDLRPVFDDDLDGPLVASLIAHTLKLSVHRDGKHEDVYVVMDTDDLTRLQDTVARALKKARSLARVVSSAPNNFLGTSIDGLSDE